MHHVKGYSYLQGYLHVLWFAQQILQRFSWSFDDPGTAESWSGGFEHIYTCATCFNKIKLDCSLTQAKQNMLVRICLLHWLLLCCLFFSSWITSISKPWLFENLLKIRTNQAITAWDVQRCSSNLSWIFMDFLSKVLPQLMTHLAN